MVDPVGCRPPQQNTPTPSAEIDRRAPPSVGPVCTTPRYSSEPRRRRRLGSLPETRGFPPTFPELIAARSLESTIGSDAALSSIDGERKQLYLRNECVIRLGISLQYIHMLRSLHSRLSTSVLCLLLPRAQSPAAQRTAATPRLARSATHTHSATHTRAQRVSARVTHRR